MDTTIVKIARKKSSHSREEKKLFNPDLAIIPIMIARWGTSFEDAIISYQNEISFHKLGSFVGTRFEDLFNEICKDKKDKRLLELKNNKSISLAGKLKNIDIKFHASIHENIIQISISDNTKILKYRDATKRNELIDSFLMIGSHELKTPLNGIMGISSLLLEKELDADTLEMLELINKSSITLNNTINKMLKNIYLNNDSGQINVLEEIKIGDKIMESWPLIKRYLVDYEFSSNSIELKDTKSVHLPNGMIDDILMEILINLKRNTQPGKSIKVSSSDIHDGVILKIENHSNGIPPEYINKIFDPFFRYQDKLNHSSGFEFGKAGMGMGLTIVKRYIDQIGGKIWFENKYEYEEGKENVVILNIEFPA